MRTTYNFWKKNVLVMGLGLHGGGVGTVKFLAREGARLAVTDLRTSHILAPSLKALARYKKISYIFGRHRKGDFENTDIIMKNPGVPADSPYLAYARTHNIPIATDVGIFFSRCPATIIGVTGTRGKSTTAFLIWKLLSSLPQSSHTQPQRVWCAGNIRKSVLELLPRLKPHDIVVLELSSFQLEDLIAEKKSPHVAVFTNILRDHLNRHGTMRAYEKIKATIFKFQTARDYLFANGDDPRVYALAKKAPSQVIFPKLPLPFKKVVNDRLGEHYQSSAALAIAVARHFGLTDNTIKKILSDFHGLEGRQQKIATIRGAHYINDTTATVPDATIAAIKRFRQLSGNHRLILIAGGQDKNLNFQLLADRIKKYVDTVIFLPGSATHRIKKLLPRAHIRGRLLKTLLWATSMRDAVTWAIQCAEKGDYVVLSPGAASFGLFHNEFDRGEQFNQLILEKRGS